METKLRVKEVSPADPNYVHNRTEPEIEPNPEHGGLRVRDHGKFPLVESHPLHPSKRRHPEHESLARLGDNRERK